MSVDINRSLSRMREKESINMRALTIDNSLRMRKQSLSVHAINVAENETNAAMRSRTIDRYHGTI